MEEQMRVDYEEYVDEVGEDNAVDYETFVERTIAISERLIGGDEGVRVYKPTNPEWWAHQRSNQRGATRGVSPGDPQ